MSSLFELFAKLERDRWSGEIGISSSQGNATVLIREGQFIWCHRPIDRAVERISKFPWIKMPPEAILRNCKTWEDLVRMFLHANPDSYNQLIRYLKTDRLELFFRIFFWSNIEIASRAFTVEPPDPVELGFYSMRKLSTLLKEAQRRVTEWPQIQEQVGSSKRIFICQIDLPHQDEAPRDAIDQAFLEKEDSISAVLPFSPEEIEILRQCDGTRTVQDIVRDSIDGEFLTLRRLLALWEKHAIAPKDDENFQSARLPKASPLSLKEVIRALFLSLVTALLFWAAGKVERNWGGASLSPVPVQQSLEIFKHRHGRYPLTLSELPALNLPSRELSEHFDYKLLHPLDYRLVVK